MANEVQSTGNQPTERVVEDANLTAFVSSLALAVNDTYSYNKSSQLFTSLIPSYNRDYAWRYVRNACQWMDGYVPSLHDGTSGIMSTRIASRLITGLTKQVCGERLVYKLADETSADEDTLNEISKWSEKKKPMKAIYAGVGFALSIGTSLIKLNVSKKNGKRDVWLEAKRMDECYYLADNEGDVREATFYIRPYTDTRENNKDGQKAQYILCEHRFYECFDKPVFTKDMVLVHKKNERVPKTEFKVYRTQGTMLNGAKPLITSGGCRWEEISKDVRDMIKQDYNFIRIGEPEELPFTNLGVFIFKNGHQDLSIPSGSGFGESLLVGIQSDLITYEYAESCQLRDMYLGKGQVYLPKTMNMGDLAPKADKIAIGGALSELGNDNQAFTFMNGIDPEQQKAIVQQFEIREENWQRAKENALKDIAIKWGMSAKILASYLAQTSGQQTATQVDSEDDMSIAFISLTRSYFLPTINDIFETVMQYKGLVNNISINFASPSLVNKDRLLDRIIKMLDAGLIDIEEAIRTYYPDASEKELKRKIEIAQLERQKAQQQAQAEFNSFGDYTEDDNFGQGNNYDDLGGDNLSGSTTPTQK